MSASTGSGAGSEVDVAIAEWLAAQERVVGLTSGLTPAEADRRVPATPAWSVRDLLSHVIGLDADYLAGNRPDDHNAAWTQAQVEARADRDVAGLLAEWAALRDPLVDWMRAHGTRPLGDVVIHEQDLRGALDAPGAQDTAGLRAIRDRMAGRFAGNVGAAGLAPIRLQGPGWTFEARADGDTRDPDVVVTASDFDLARAVIARRSAAQLRAWTTSGDVGPYLDAFAVLGPLPERDLAI